MPKFMLLLREDPNQFREFSPQDMERVIQKYREWAGSIGKAGHAISGEKLADDGGRVLRRSGNDVRVLDGPFSETKEVIGGFFTIDAADYDEAVRLARGCPQLDHGSVEVRVIEET